MRSYKNPTSDPAMSHPLCTLPSSSVLVPTKSPSGVNSWISALMVGQKSQNPAATSVFIKYKCQT